MKILDSKKYDEQLNLTKFSIKNQLFEITKEFKEFNFQQSVRIEFTKETSAKRFGPASRILAFRFLPPPPLPSTT